MRLSASRLALAELCPGSAALPGVKESTAPMRLGTARHAEDLEILRARLTDTARTEVAYAWFPQTGMARILGYDIGRAYDEHGATPSEIVGSADIVDWSDDSLEVWDYKSGDAWQLPPREHLQILFLALAAVRAARGAKRARIGIIRRLDEAGHPRAVLTDELDVFDLAAVEERVREVWERHVRAVEVVATGNVPDLQIGEHCRWCNARWSCPAQASAAQALVAARIREATFTPELIGVLWPLVKGVRGVLEEAEERIRDYVVDNGPVTLPDGRVLRAVERTRAGYTVGPTTYKEVRAVKVKP